MSQEQIVSPPGTTDLRVESMTYHWAIKNVDQLTNPKIRSLCKLTSPTFTTETRARPGMIKEWHLELFHTKNDWMKCSLVQEDLEQPEMMMRTVPSILNHGVNITSSQMMEKLTGSFVYAASLIKNDGSIETLKELMDKSETIDGWTMWASRFCEKRRKMGCVEFLFGENHDCSVNAIPMDYLWDKKDQYVLDNTIRLQVELLFTHNVTTPPCHFSATTNHRSKSTSERLQAQLDKLALIERLGRFHNNHLFSDLKLKCGHRTFPVHKLLLVAKAEHFVNSILAKQTTSSNCSEPAGDATSSSETIKLDTTDTIVIEDLQPEILELLLEFIYKATIPEGTSTQTLSNLTHWAKMYQIESLTQHIESIIVKRGSS